MKNRGIKAIAMLALVCVLVTAFAVTACAASYSKVYGQTQDKVRVRASASTNAAITDNIVKDACVYVTSSKTSGSMTFVKVNYRALDGDVESGWVCQSDSDTTYVKILSGDQAKKEFSVSGGDLPSRKVGTFTDAQRKASTADSSNTYIKANSTGESVKDVQTKLKALGYYSGTISGSVGPLTEEAIKAFQKKNGLTADGVAGPQTIAKLDAVYGGKAASSDGSIRLGASGTAVRDLQTDLTALGYYWAEITGKVGSKTEAAIKEFQKDYGLTADGIAGKKTLDAIAAAIARKGGTSASSASSGSVLKLGSKGDSVAQLQTNLATLGYYYADITGSFGSKTEAAVKAFQKAKGLTNDGIAGKKTLDAIAAALGGSAASGSVSSASGMKLGSTGSSVTALQTDLTTLGYYYGDITGRFGSLTEKAVKAFQKSRGLTQDGVAGSRTVAAIENAIKNSGGVSAGTSSVGSSLREGDSGSAVLEMQTMLKDLGYYYGELTGSFGSRTKQAVKKFQDDNDLTVDGIAGTKTLNKLYSLSGKGSGSSSSGTSVSTADSYGRIIKNNVYLRASYSTTSASKASLDKGKLLRITKKVTSGDYTWYYVSVKSGSYTYTGYVRSDMMETITESEYNSAGGNSSNNYSDMETLGMIKVTGDNVSLRYSPSTSAERVGVANKGDVFYYVDSVSGWFQTRTGYWISKDYADVMSADEVEDYRGSDSSSGSVSYKLYDIADEIKTAQERLTALKYYNNTCSGRLGPKTQDAIKKFQKDHGLTADGVLGPKTIAKISEEYFKKFGSSVSGTVGDVIYNLSWPSHYSTSFKSAGFVKHCEDATLTDIETGLTFKIYVQSLGSTHTDVEPLTAGDTATMCRIYGVSKSADISWERRAMILTTKSGDQFVCSVYGVPHGQDDKNNNDYEGQFCVHMKDSDINAGDGGSVRPEENHQAIIKNAVKDLEDAGKTIKTVYP